MPISSLCKQQTFERQVISIARSVRSDICKTSSKGRCLDVSSEIQTQLIRAGFTVSLQLGSFKDCPHAWVSIWRKDENGMSVWWLDATLDQFGDYPGVLLIKADDADKMGLGYLP